VDQPAALLPRSDQPAVPLRPAPGPFLSMLLTPMFCWCVYRISCIISCCGYRCCPGVLRVFLYSEGVVQRHCLKKTARYFSVLLPCTAPISTLLPRTAPYCPMLLCFRRCGTVLPIYPLYRPVIWKSMQVKRRAATAVVARLARGVGRVVKAVWAAPAGRGATGVTSTKGLFELVPAESVPCLLGVNPLQLPPSRVGWTQAYRRVHTWTFALWGVRLTFCGLSGAYSCLGCCLTGSYLLALRLFTVAIWYVALRVHVGREGRDGVVDEGREGWCSRAGGKEYQTHRAAAPPHPVPLP